MTLPTTAASYTLDPARVPDLMDELARERTLDRRTTLALVAGGPDGTVAQLARGLEQQVFGAEFDNSAEEMVQEYGPYEAVSSFLLVGDFQASRPVGVIRMIRPSEVGLKSINDLEPYVDVSVAEFLAREELDSVADCLDIATCAVAAAYRGARHHRVSSLLYRALVMTTQRTHAKRLVAIVDDKALRSFRFVGTPAHPVAGTNPFSYLGCAQAHAVTIATDQLEAGGLYRARELRERAVPRLSDVIAPQRLLERHLTARAVHDIATGRHLDRSIHL